MRWNESRCIAKRVGENRFDDVTVRARDPDDVLAVFFGQPCVVLSDRGNGSRLYLGQPFTAGKHCTGSVALHHFPERFFQEFLERATRPVAVIDLDEAILDHRRQTTVDGNGADRLLTPQQRRADDLRDVQTDQPIDDAFGLFPAVVVEFHTRRSTGQGNGQCWTSTARAAVGQLSFHNP